MGVRSEFRDWILSIAEVKRLVGTRLLPDEADEATQAPYGVYQRVGVAGWPSLASAARGRTVGFLLGFAAKTSAEREEIAEAVRTRIEGIEGPFQIGETVYAERLTIEDENDYFVQTSDGGDGLFAVDFQIMLVHDGRH